MMRQRVLGAEVTVERGDGATVVEVAISVESHAWPLPEQR
jgi:hypothetical protein